VGHSLAVAGGDPDIDGAGQLGSGVTNALGGGTHIATLRAIVRLSRPIADPQTGAGQPRARVVASVDYD